MRENLIARTGLLTLISASRFSLMTSVNMDSEFSLANVSPALLGQMEDVLDAPVLVPHSATHTRLSWRRFIADTTPCYHRILNLDDLQPETGEPRVQFWFFQLRKAKTEGTSIWSLRNPDRLSNIARTTLGWNTFHFLRKYVPLAIAFSTTDFDSEKIPVLLPHAQSFNELLDRWVSFQKKKSTQKFMDVYRRSGQVDGQFDQGYFRDWLEAELQRMDTFYLLDFFKRMVRETISPDGFSVTRIFPRIDQERIEIIFVLLMRKNL